MKNCNNEDGTYNSKIIIIKNVYKTDNSYEIEKKMETIIIKALKRIHGKKQTDFIIGIYYVILHLSFVCFIYYENNCIVKIQL